MKIEGYEEYYEDAGMSENKQKQKSINHNMDFKDIKETREVQ